MSIQKTYRFSRKEHLKSPAQIASLFTTGKGIKSYPLKFQYILEKVDEDTESSERMKIAFSVPKRSFKKAVHRNRIKRQMIEMFRLNREHLKEVLDDKNLRLSMMVLYYGNQLPDYHKLEKRMLSGINKLCERL